MKYNARVEQNSPSCWLINLIIWSLLFDYYLKLLRHLKSKTEGVSPSSPYSLLNQDYLIKSKVILPDDEDWSLHSTHLFCWTKSQFNLLFKQISLAAKKGQQQRQKTKTDITVCRRPLASRRLKVGCPNQHRLPSNAPRLFRYAIWRGLQVRRACGAA